MTNHARGGSNDGRRSGFFDVGGESLLWEADQPSPELASEVFTLYRRQSDEGAIAPNRIGPLGSIDFATRPPTIVVVHRPSREEMAADTALLEKAVECLAQLRDEISKKPSRNTGRGFAEMTPERRRALGSKGGRTAHARGTAHSFNSETASVAGRVAHERGTAHTWTSETARQAGRKGGVAPRRARGPMEKVESPPEGPAKDDKGK